jgi:hypothetical protein
MPEKEKSISKPAQSPEQPRNSSAVQAQGKFIYLGPPMMEKDFQINYGTIYSNGLPDEVKERMKTDNAFAKLFVPVGNAAKAMQELTKSDTDLFAAKEKVSREYIERRKKGGK